MPESWIKVHTDALHDPKLLLLHPTSRWAWIGLLLLCRSGNPPGTWKARSRETAAEDLNVVLSLGDPIDNDMSPLVGDINRMVELGMIAVDGEGLVTVLHWSARQGDLRPSASPEKVRDRKRLSRSHAMSRDVTPRVDKSRVDQKKQHPPLPPSPGGSAPQNGAGSLEAFERFWLEYPKPRRKAKWEARKAWTALRPNAETIARIMRSLAAWKASDDWTKEAGKFVPWPQKFLNRHRWEDIPDPAQSTLPRL